MEDSVDKINNEIYKKHTKELKYRAVKNKKLLICFGAVPGSGKTYISKILEKKYRGVRINTENIGEIIDSLSKKNSYAKKNKHKILDEYIFQFLRFRSSPNDLTIATLDKDFNKIDKLKTLIF